MFICLNILGALLLPAWWREVLPKLSVESTGILSYRMNITTVLPHQLQINIGSIFFYGTMFKNPTWRSLFRQSGCPFLAARWRALKPTERNGQISLKSITTSFSKTSRILPVPSVTLISTPWERMTSRQSNRPRDAQRWNLRIEQCFWLKVFTIFTRKCHLRKASVWFNIWLSWNQKSTHADLPSVSNLEGERPFFTSSAATFSGSFCSTACSNLSSVLLQSWL